MRITSVYTRSGDDGTTALVGGQRVAKNALRIEAYGTCDELATILGWARQEIAADIALFQKPEDAAALDAVLEFIGNKLFTMGGDLATRLPDRHPQMPVIDEGDIKFLEKVCDVYNGALPPLKDFVLPGGSRVAAALHVARAVARRCERLVIGLAQGEDLGPHMIKYVNRLSDALFVLARWANLKQGVEEVIWRRDLPAPL